ncbi:MAG: hypothetical protein KAS12_05360, partial [Candidatus Aenigmarchaeota archaeon]|nr:hypothetical protein [Candidatus Aenigmarchaeota archaeon]
FYGNNDGRQIEVSQPKLYNFVKPPEIKYVETEELEPGEKKRIESAHTGCDAVFTRKIIYSDETDKEETWYSHYRAWPEMWLVGIEPKPEGDLPEDKEGENIDSNSVEEE